MIDFQIKTQVYFPTDLGWIIVSNVNVQTKYNKQSIFYGVFMFYLYMYLCKLNFEVKKSDRRPSRTPVTP